MNKKIYLAELKRLEKLLPFKSTFYLCKIPANHPKVLHFANSSESKEIYGIYEKNQNGYKWAAGRTPYKVET
jgi:hypothetical protein